MTTHTDHHKLYYFTILLNKFQLVYVLNSTNSAMELLHINGNGDVHVG
jgi:hypothetical protein